MSDLDYKVIEKTENFANYASDIEVFGKVDFLFAHRKYSLEMLKRSKEMPILKGKIKAKVVGPEDIIGLKIQSVVNNPERERKDDMLDIENIIKLNKGELDMEQIREYFALFNKEDVLNNLLERTKNA